VKAEDALNGFPVFGGCFEVVDHVNTPDHQHPAFFFNFSLYFSYQQTVSGRNLARFQRAAKGAGQSAACCGHQVIQGGGVRLVDVGVNVVMLGNFCVNPKENRLWPSPEDRPA
jgi:hypothetical protein